MTDSTRRDYRTGREIMPHEFGDGRNWLRVPSRDGVQRYAWTGAWPTVDAHGYVQAPLRAVRWPVPVAAGLAMLAAWLLWW